MAARPFFIAVEVAIEISISALCVCCQSQKNRVEANL